MNFPTSSIGLPQSLKYDLPPILPDSARAYKINLAPDGIKSVAGPVPPAAPFTINSGTYMGPLILRLFHLLFQVVCHKVYF